MLPQQSGLCYHQIGTVTFFVMSFRLHFSLTDSTLFFTCRYVIVVEHDLSVLDYLSDFICCLYGVPGAYGVVTMPFSVREGKLDGHNLGF